VAEIVVQKFGGTSVQDARAMLRVIDIVKTHGVAKSLRPLVVLSACAGVTNTLIRIGELAILGKTSEAHDEVTALEERHHHILRDLKLRYQHEQEASLSLRSLWRELRTAIRGIELLGELTPKVKDKIFSVGERASTTIFYHLAKEKFKGKQVLFLDARDFFLTDSHFTSARPNDKGIRLRMKPIVKKLSGGAIGITQGFIGATDRGETTTIGRGGSDFSAAIMGTATDAKEIQIWTDVAGIFTCDPRIVAGAFALPRISFDEASVMAYYGAKVLHPETIWPAVSAGIPVRVLSSKEPRRKGTTIVAGSKNTPAVSGIAITKNVTLVKLRSKNSIPSSVVSAKVFAALERKSIVPLASSLSFDDLMLALAPNQTLADVQSTIEKFAAMEFHPSKALITLVGHALKDAPGSAARFFSAIDSVNCEMISFGGVENALSVIITESDMDKAVRLIHKEFFGK
jgi:aspartate kinase